MSDPIRPPTTIRWSDDGEGLLILDQTELPERVVERDLRTVAEVEEAIRSLRVRGAPLIGVTAAMGVGALARQWLREAVESDNDGDAAALLERVSAWCDRLAEARPTAVNLVWAIDRIRVAAMAHPADAAAVVEAIAAEADRIREEDARMCRRIGEHAVRLLRNGSRVITHCNAGALATAGIGTALAPLYVAHERGLALRVYADETRPLLQGSRLTAWELAQAGIDVTVISDNTAGALMSREPPDIVFVGSDRIAANGDVANKIGTYGLAVLAHHHGVPFYALAPTSTVDLEAATGADIPIEHRAADEVRRGFGQLTAPADAEVWSPAFDVTPAELVAGIVTEQGLHGPPFVESLAEAVRRAEAERAG